MIFILSVWANEWVTIPEGTFQMGCDSQRRSSCSEDELPAHSVKLSSFGIQKTEVTRAEWAECVATGGCTSHVYDWNPDVNPIWPVTGINKFEAEAYCGWIGGRLPTEAEWEFAALGSDGRQNPWGAEPASCDWARLRGCGAQLGPVGAFPMGASPFGVLDMIGNAWEFVRDYYQNGYYAVSEEVNPTGPGETNMAGIRGLNSFQLIDVYATQRMTGPIMVRSSVLGVRCARDGGGQ